MRKNDNSSNMQTVLLQSPLGTQDLEILRKEFPNFRFLLLPKTFEEQYLTKEEWSNIEIFYGDHFPSDCLTSSPRLRWVHIPNENLRHVCLPEILEKGNVIVTTGGEQSFIQVAEYVMGGVLCIAKRFFHWFEIKNKGEEIWESAENEEIWTLKDKNFLQIGLGKAGTEIAKRAQQFDMKVWGVQLQSTFHPYCHHTLSMRDLNLVLPIADITCVCLPLNEERENFLGESEIKLLKKGSILILVGSYKIANEQALAALAAEKKLRGIILDATYWPNISETSPLWNVPDLLITPEIAPKPRISEKDAFQTFHYNLRQYRANNFIDMRNRID